MPEKLENGLTAFKIVCRNCSITSNLKRILKDISMFRSGGEDCRGGERKGNLHF